MKMKEVIFLKVAKKIPQDIKDQVRWWDILGKLLPLICVVLGATGYLMGVELEILLGIILAMCAVTAITWWFWTINTIARMSDKIRSAETGVQQVLSDIQIIKELVKEIRKSSNY
jgi:hypothetical protein